MSSIPISSEILGAMITPAVLISASWRVGSLSTSNRVESNCGSGPSSGGRSGALATVCPRAGRRQARAKLSSRRKRVADQLSLSCPRARFLLRSAMTALYSAIGLLVGTSILVGVVARPEWQYSALPVVAGLRRAPGALLYGSLLLVREARSCRAFDPARSGVRPGSSSRKRTAKRRLKLSAVEDV